MGHIELREVDDDDLDAVYEMTRDAVPAPWADFLTGDREAFDEWMTAQRAAEGGELRAVLEDGVVVGLATAFMTEGDPGIGCLLTRDAWDHGVGAVALSALVTLAPDRPLLARAWSDNTAEVDILTKLGFTELSRTPMSSGPRREDVLYALPPTLE